MRQYLYLTLLTSLTLGWELKPALQKIIEEKAEFYNCTMAFGYHNETDEYQMVSGDTDRTSGKKIATDTKFVWGSVTKVATGSAVLRLAESGAISLSDPIVPLIDPFIKKSMPKLVSLENLFGSEVKDVTVRDLLGMKSGIPDFDTEEPRGHGGPVDPFRATVYANPQSEYGPEELLSLSWVKTGKLDFTPGKCDRLRYFNCYSSTNYVLLGLLLANHAGAESWEEY